MRFAIINGNKVVEYREYSEPPVSKLVDGLPACRPVRTVPAVVYNPALHNKTATVQITAAEVIETEVLEPKTTAQLNAQIKAQIAELERGQGRAMREATLGLPGAADRLTALNNDVAALRTKLV